MPQHFLLNADARSLSPLAIARLSDDKAHVCCVNCVGAVVRLWYALSVANSIKPITSPHADNGNVSIAVTVLV